ncbi:MAG TPA: FKBP-type peptidyl-prolyl cis-trans isomerase [Pseudomonadales bacterium]|jgi:FKBP-type peptidyl-prolyl cis-trans isomerase FklB|nr:FKBP-type peptidyl-prolyl cis-trans isomerase [Pseudomonadales bacterium]
MKIPLPSQVAPHGSIVAIARTTLVIALALGIGACQKAAPPEPVKGPELESEVAKASYGLGYNIAGNIENQYGKALDTKAFQTGIDDGFAGTKAKVPEDQVLAALNALNDARAEEKGKLAETNLAAAKAYLAENGKKEGVVTTASGLQYQILVTGKGPKPSLTDTVTTHYTGTLIDGTVFDSSVERGSPAAFPVNGVIPGWVEALQLMPVGSKWRIVVPPELAYKERGAGNRIGPNEALIFEVELISKDPS